MTSNHPDPSVIIVMCIIIGRSVFKADNKIQDHMTFLGAMASSGWSLRTFCGERSGNCSSVVFWTHY